MKIKHTINRMLLNTPRTISPHLSQFFMEKLYYMKLTPNAKKIEGQ